MTKHIKMFENVFVQTDHLNYLQTARHFWPGPACPPRTHNPDGPCWQSAAACQVWKREQQMLQVRIKNVTFKMHL